MKTNFFSPGILIPKRGKGTRSILAGALLATIALSAIPYKRMSRNI